MPHCFSFYIFVLQKINLFCPSVSWNIYLLDQDKTQNVIISLPTLEIGGFKVLRVASSYTCV